MAAFLIASKQTKVAEVGHDRSRSGSSIGSDVAMRINQPFGGQDTMTGKSAERPEDQFERMAT